MNVIEYLKSNSLDQLKADFQIKVKQYPNEGLVVLNYNNGSPKNPIVADCRGLILGLNGYNIVSRSFDRFYNFKEYSPQEQREYRQMCESTFYAMEKIDGSLIKIYHFKGEWHISTRGLAFAEGMIASSTTTFRSAVLDALEIKNEAKDAENELNEKFQIFCKDCKFQTDRTYICELTGKDNRIVTEYDPNKYQLWLLGVRSNRISGEYFDSTDIQHPLINRPKIHQFKSIEAATEMCSKFKDLTEGFVIYGSRHGKPLCKIKSPVYVLMHHVVDSASVDGVLSKQEICRLISTDDWPEFLSYFPQYQDTVSKYVKHCEEYFDSISKEFQQKRALMKHTNDFTVFQGKPWRNLAIQAVKSNRNNLHTIYLEIENKKFKYLMGNVFKDFTP